MSDQLRVGEAIIDLLTREYGVDTVFGIPGVHNIELYRGLHRSGVRAISPRHEQGAGFMADGWSVITGKPGVCVLISGPGLTNALTPIAQAYHDSRPMLIIASTTPTNALGKSFGPLHDLPDQAALVRSICAFSETVTDAQELPQLIERAWNVFTSQRPRPVHLAIPMDVLEQMCARFEKVDTEAHRPVPAASEIKRAVELINAATNPIVVAGGGCVDAGAQLAKFAEAIDAPVVLTGNAKGVLSSTHPLCAGNCLVFGLEAHDWRNRAKDFFTQDCSIRLHTHEHGWLEEVTFAFARLSTNDNRATLLNGGVYQALHVAASALVDYRATGGVCVNTAS